MYFIHFLFVFRIGNVVSLTGIGNLGMRHVALCLPSNGYAKYSNTNHHHSPNLDLAYACQLFPLHIDDK